jgi:hypothetical protein
MGSSRHIMVILLAFVLGACASDTITEPETEAPGLQPPIEPVERWSCYDPVDPHCINEPAPLDPSAGEPGYYLGPDFSYDACTEGINDADRDGLGDFCEYQLALAFRPELMMSRQEPAAGREEYWAATRIGTNVVIVYMFGFYQDNGDPGCPTFLDPVCRGHWGDNEFTVAYLIFDDSTQHWKLTGQYYSAHWGTGMCADLVDCDFSGFRFHDSLWYPKGESRTYTRVWIARSKHANYASMSACNTGALLDADDCSDNVSIGRFNVNANRNVGSGHYQFINEVTSIDNPLTRPGKEYFWWDIPFCGWSVTSASRLSCAPTSYFDVLWLFLYSLPWW